MAEAIVSCGRAGDWEAVSAGSRPAGFVHSLAVRVLSEIGVDSVSEFCGQPFDLARTVCSSAGEECPVWLGQGRRAHREYPVPALLQGRA